MHYLQVKSETLGSKGKGIYEGGHIGRGAWYPNFRGNLISSKANGRGWRKANPMAHYEDLLGSWSE